MTVQVKSLPNVGVQHPGIDNHQKDLLKPKSTVIDAAVSSILAKNKCAKLQYSAIC